MVRYVGRGKGRQFGPAPSGGSYQFPRIGSRSWVLKSDWLWLSRQQDTRDKFQIVR